MEFNLIFKASNFLINIQLNNNNNYYSLIKTTQNGCIRTNSIKAKMDRTHQNSKYYICRERYETINHIVLEWIQKQAWLGRNGNSLRTENDLDLTVYRNIINTCLK